MQATQCWAFESVALAVTYQAPLNLKMDCDKSSNLLEARRTSSKTGMVLADFVAKAKEIHPELEEEHVLALRLYVCIHAFEPLQLPWPTRGQYARRCVGSSAASLCIPLA